MEMQRLTPETPVSASAKPAQRAEDENEGSSQLCVAQQTGPNGLSSEQSTSTGRRTATHVLTDLQPQNLPVV